jgi:uncharacterized surface protein with fasciclin (FAS1) repeats
MIVARRRETAPETKDIVETVVDAGRFKTFAAAVGAVRLTEALRGKGPFTVFAPTDAAFEKLTRAAVNQLLDPEKLAAIVMYHLVAERLTTDDLVKLHFATTVQGGRLTIGASYDGFTVDDAKLIETDIECSNGVIHAIDTLLTPE